MSDILPLYDKPRVGGDILCFCSRCVMTLAHVVVAMADGRARRVICKTCKSEHSYRAGGSPKKINRSGGTCSTKTTMLVVEFWQKKIDECKGDPISYAPTKSFRKGDCLSHPKFGLGYVEKERLAGKILVFFRDGEKVLIHSHSKTNAQ